MLSVANFNNQSLNLNLSVFKDENENVFFPAADFSRKLGYENAMWAVRTHVSDEYKVRYEDLTKGARIAHLGIHPHTLFLPEEGAYQLTLRSNLPSAREFQKWVFEILKSIRKTGAYHLPGALPKFRAITDHDFEMIMVDEQQTKELRTEMDVKRNLIKDRRAAERGRVGGSVMQQRRRDMERKIEEQKDDIDDLKEEIEMLAEDNERLFEDNETMSEEMARLTFNESASIDKIKRLESEINGLRNLAFDYAETLDYQTEVIKRMESKINSESEDSGVDDNEPENLPLPKPNEEGL